MPFKSPLRLLSLLVPLCLAGCDLLSAFSDPPESQLSKEAIATRDALPEDIFRGELAGQQVFLLLHDCEVYQVQLLDKGEVKWESVLAPDFYPFWTACQRQSMTYAGGELTVVLGRMAVGAGGCCATGGTYRSRDGRNWTQVSSRTSVL